MYSKVCHLENGPRFKMAFFFFFFLAFYRRLWFLRIKICNIYISKATAIIRETFQYSRKVQGMFSIKDSMRN